LWSVGGLLALVVILWLAAAAYLSANREKVLASVLEQLNESLGGRLEVGSMEPTLIGDFPNVSLALQDVHLRDSLWKFHRRDLLAARTIYVKVAPVSVLTGDGITVRQVRISGASFDLFVDSTGYSNAYLLKSKKDTTGKKRREGPSIRRALLDDVRVVIQNVPKEKLFRLHIRSLALRAKDRGTKEEISVQMDVHIGGLGFNLARGTFAKNKRMRADWDVTWDKTQRQIILPLQDARFNGDRLKLGLVFDLSPGAMRYDVRIVAPSIRLDTGASYLAENISSKLALIKLADPLTAEARIAGEIHERNPKVHVTFAVKDNVLTTPGGVLTDCSFTGLFDNEVAKGQPRTDPNSVIEVDAFAGTYKGIPLKADTLAIRNLITPRLTAMVRSNFDAEKLNGVTGGKPFRFTAGRVALRVRYEGSLSLIDPVIPDLRGTVQLSDGAAVYVPRGLAVRGLAAQLVFEGQSIRFPQVALAVGSSSVQMSGEARELLTALHDPSQAASLYWNVRAPQIALADFLPFIRQREGGGSRGPVNRTSPIADRLDHVLDAADAHFNVVVNNLQYRQLRAQDVRAAVVLTRTHARVPNASLRVAGGSVRVSGEAEQSGPFNAQVGVESLSLVEILRILNNFGQDAITPSNVRGNAWVDARIAGRLNNEGDLLRNGLSGDVTLRLQDGALIGFQPLERIGRYVFRKRNLSNIRLEPLTARFHLRGDKIQLDPMEVHSSALTINMHGVYGLQSGTDLHVQVPLRNPKKDSVDIAEGVIAERGEKGVTVHLRAKNPTGQKLDIDWDRGGKDYKAALGARRGG